MVTLLLLLAPALAGPPDDGARSPGQPRSSTWHGTLGVDWTPFGRADLAWVEADQLSDTLVAATDGMLAPPLALHGGATTARHALLASLAMGRLGTTEATYDTEGAIVSRSASHVMGVRLGADWRGYLSPRVLPGSGARPRVAPYVQAGAYGVIPSARRADETWTEEEQAAQDGAAGADRARIGALGGRAGGGAEACWDLGLCLGLRGLVVLHRSQEVGEGYKTVTLLAAVEPALTLDLGF